MSSKNKRDEFLTRVTQKIMKAGNPQKILLFGSRASGNASKDSDFDFLIIENSEQPRFRRSAKYRRAFLLLSLHWVKEVIK